MAIAALAIPVAFDSLPPPVPGSDAAIERLLDPSIGDSTDGAAAATQVLDFDRFKEQVLDLLPGGAIETLARSFADRQVQLRISHHRTLLIVRITLD